MTRKPKVELNIDQADFDPELRPVSVAVSDLRPNTYNPNQQSVADFGLLVQSIKEDGFTTPVIVNDGSVVPELKDMIIDGEHRWRAAVVLGMSHVPVVYRGYDEAKMRLSTLRHNEARGHHDALLEAQLLHELSDSGVSQADLSEQLNIDPVELDVLLRKSDDYVSSQSVAKLLKDEHLEQLAERGITGEGAETIAQRHAVIGAADYLKGQNDRTRQAETNTTARIELVFTNEQFEKIRPSMTLYDSPKSFLLGACKWWKTKNGG